MLQVVGEICSVTTCTRPGCNPMDGCQGHAVREIMPTYIKEHAEALVKEAEKWGFILTIEQRPVPPLKMGNFETTVSVRQKFKREPA